MSSLHRICKASLERSKPNYVPSSDAISPLHCETKKARHPTRVDNFAKY